MSFNTFIDMGELGNQEVTVEFDFENGCAGSNEDQSYYAKVQITKITWRGIDIFDCIDDFGQFVDEEFFHLEDIENQAKEDRAEYMPEMREDY